MVKYNDVGGKRYFDTNIILIIMVSGLKGHAFPIDMKKHDFWTRKNMGKQPE